MNDLIIGTGRKSSLDEVLRVSETEVVRKFGKPRGMVARGHGIEIHTARHAFDGPFEQISVRIPSEGRLVASMRALVAGCLHRRDRRKPGVAIAAARRGGQRRG